MPWGQKKKTREMSHSQTVMPPEAETEGTTERLTMATTKSSTRSQRPRTRLRCADSGCGSVVDISQMLRGPKPAQGDQTLGPIRHGQSRAPKTPDFWFVSKLEFTQVSAKKAANLRHLLSASRPRPVSPSALRPGPERFRRRPAGAWRCLPQYAGQRWSTARPTSRAGPSRCG